MGMGKSGGGYVQQLTEIRGSTESDDEKLEEAVAQTLQHLTFGVSDPWQGEHSDTFDGRTAPVASQTPQTARPSHAPRSSPKSRTAMPAAMRPYHRCHIRGDALPPLKFGDRIPTTVNPSQAQPRTAASKPSTVVTVFATEPKVCR